MKMNSFFPLRVNKSLLDWREKARIVRIMQSTTPPRSARGWAMTFKRLPTTIVKIAAENGITLRHD